MKDKICMTKYFLSWFFNELRKYFVLQVDQISVFCNLLVDNLYKVESYLMEILLKTLLKKVFTHLPW